MSLNSKNEVVNLLFEGGSVPAERLTTSQLLARIGTAIDDFEEHRFRVGITPRQRVELKRLIAAEPSVQFWEGYVEQLEKGRFHIGLSEKHSSEHDLHLNSSGVMVEFWSDGKIGEIVFHKGSPREAGPAFVSKVVRSESDQSWSAAQQFVADIVASKWHKD